MSNYRLSDLISQDELMHHGIKGQKWGVRRYQNKDGSLTTMGKRRYANDDFREKMKKIADNPNARKSHRKIAEQFSVETDKYRKTMLARAFVNSVAQAAIPAVVLKLTQDTKPSVNPKIFVSSIIQNYTLESMYNDMMVTRIDKKYDDDGNKKERKKEGFSHSDITLDELMHYGIKGQKWGRRRYQNEDGSLTPEGAKRYGSEEKFNKYYEKDIKRESDHMKLYQHQANKASKDLNDISDDRYNKRIKKMKETNEEEIRDKVYKMTDQELKEAVNRMNMEERYAQIMKDRTKIDVGRSKSEKFMDFSAAALSTVASGLTIAIMLKELQK